MAMMTVYHCDNIDTVSDDFIEEADIKKVSLIMWVSVNTVFLRIGISEKYIIPLSAKKLMIITVVYIMKIRHIYLNHIAKIKCYKSY